MATETLTQTIATLTLRTTEQSQTNNEKKVVNGNQNSTQGSELYRYAHLLPVFDKSEHYQPLTPFEHVDPGLRALKHDDPRSFLRAATSVDDLTPDLGTEIRGVNLAKLTSDERDQIALEVARRGLLVFRDQQEFIDSSPEFYLDWGRHFGR